ncbi:MAG TPA: hypothetical protein VFY10_11450 [Dehalococcoidia bacterium]|nr:hypothetical protein [Dehalococcoidia bacterium]
MDSTSEIHDRLEELISEARHAVHETEDAREEALLETTAEVLGGLARAYEDMANRSEEAWRGPGRPKLKALSKDSSDEA